MCILMNNFVFHEMAINDYEKAITLWQKTAGLGLSGADSREGIRVFLKRNPGLSFVCVEGERLIGTILGGHDGRRGYIVHWKHSIERVSRSVISLSIERTQRRNYSTTGWDGRSAPRLTYFQRMFNVFLSCFLSQSHSSTGTVRINERKFIII